MKLLTLLILISCSKMPLRNISSEESSASARSICVKNFKSCSAIAQILFQQPDTSCAQERNLCLTGSDNELQERHTILNKNEDEFILFFNKVPNKNLFKYVTKTHLKSRKPDIGEMAVGQFTKYGNSKGTGTLISPTRVITAFHLFEDPSGIDKFDAEIAKKVFEFRIDSGETSKIKSFRKIARARLREFANDFPYPYADYKGTYAENIEDMVIIELETPIHPSTGYFKIFSGHYSEILDKSFIMAGYPRVKIIKSQTAEFTEMDAASPKYISKPICKIGFIFKSLISSNCSPAGGISGGPLYYIDENGDRVLIGVLSSETKIVSEKFSNSMWNSMIGIDLTE